MGRVDSYQRITDTLISLVEQGGSLPWQKPWRMDAGVNQPQYLNGRRYNGGNLWTLGLVGDQYPDDPKVFGTYKKITSEGGQVSKGEKGWPVFWWQFFDVKEQGKDGVERVKQIPSLKVYVVFHWRQAEWADGEPRRVKKLRTQAESYEPPTPDEASSLLLGKLANWTEGEAIKVLRGGDSAYYSPMNDRIQLPESHLFESAGYEAAVWAHEAAHATGIEKRLNRGLDTQTSPFGSEDYSKEELVAEMASAMMCGEYGVDVSIERSAGYVEGWLGKLGRDPKLLIGAASKAEKAAKMIVGEVEQDVEVEDKEVVAA